MKNLKQKLVAGEAIIGMWVSLADPAVVEILCQTGFDFLLLDGEHSPISEEVLKLCLMAARGSKTAVIYRVRANEEPLIKIALDLGVDGLFVPMINSADDARRAVQAARYPPLGKRGVGPWRASNYFQEMWEYVASANETTTLILQIEDIQAVSHLDEILAVEGFDAAFIGPADLTASLNLLPDTQHPRVLEQIEIITDACQKVGMPVGIDAANPEHIAQMRQLGLQIFTYGADVSYLADGARETAVSVRNALVEK